MAFGIEPGEVFLYCLAEDADKPENEKTYLKLRALTAKEIAAIQDDISILPETGEVRMMSGSNLLKILLLGVVGWENLRSPSGGLIEYDKNKTPVDHLKFSWWREIADAVLDAAHVSGQLKKK